MAITNLMDFCPAFDVLAATGENLLVSINSSGQLVVTDATVVAVGTTARFADPNAVNLDERRTTLYGLEGSKCYTAISSAACTQFGKAYQAAGGKVANTGTVLLGTFYTGATGANQEVTIIRHG